MRTALAFGLILMLTGCDSEEKRAAVFMPKCLAANFTQEQCMFLFAVAEQSKSDSDNALLLAASAKR